MREIFKPQPDQDTDPGRVFYTLTAGDVGCRVIVTDIGPILVGNIIGSVQEGDVGKRLYRVPAGRQWIWQCENDAQRDRRLAGKPAITHDGLHGVQIGDGNTQSNTFG